MEPTRKTNFHVQPTEQTLCGLPVSLIPRTIASRPGNSSCDLYLYYCYHQLHEAVCILETTRRCWLETKLSVSNHIRKGLVVVGRTFCFKIGHLRALSTLPKHRLENIGQPSCGGGDALLMRSLQLTKHTMFVGRYGVGTRRNNTRPSAVPTR